MYTHQLHLKKFLTIPVIVLPLVLGPAGMALAANPTNPPPALPADQIALVGVCLSPAQVTAAAQQAVAQYVAGDQPAGVVINGNWMPAAEVATNETYVGGCAIPELLSNSTLVPSDQITMSGCPSVPQVEAAALDAIASYASGDDPAGVIVNGNWVPAGIASTGGTVGTSGCATS
ncbi:MAG: hypothetical protein ABSA91_03130 [Acidimicrobiales bacterium]